jgi:hypothetical protein
MDHPHEVARRWSLDGVEVWIWSDGRVTGVMGLGFYASPSRKHSGRRLAATELVREEVGFYEERELKKLFVVARRALEQTSLRPLEYVRRVMSGERFRRSGGVLRRIAVGRNPGSDS